MRWKPLLALGLLVPAVASAGLFGPDAPGRIPIPAHEFRARVEDRSGVVVELRRVTFDGEVFLFGTVGLAQVTVPFAETRSVTVSAGTDADHVVARAVGANGAVQDVVVERDRPLYGLASFGNYKIELGDVRKLDLADATAP